MKPNYFMQFAVDKEYNKINVQREFAAPLSKVWSAWTESQLLDQWWAPHPWKAKSKHMDFRPGGYWLYAMQGPDGTEHWSRVNFLEIVPHHSFKGYNAFCDAEGEFLPDMPGSNWTNTFQDKDQSTMVTIEIRFESLEGLEMLIKMGFREGFTSGLENLDALLAGE